MTDHHENVVSNLDIGVRFFESDVTTSGYVPFHWHSSIEVVCVLTGKLTFKFDGQSHVVGPNQFMVVSSGVVHDVTNLPNRAFVLQIPLKFFQTFYPDPERLRFVPTTANQAAYHTVLSLFDDLYRVKRDQQPGYLFDFGAVLLKLIKTLILNFTTETPNLPQRTDGIKELLVYINQHYQAALNEQQLADQFGYNASYLSRLFKKQTGVTMIQYIYVIRLNALYQDVIKSGTPIDKLFAKHGLTNKRTARQLFKEMYGVLPSELRRQQLAKQSS
ncbi:AraC family transcriptional regulator [Secundilactobacillus similis]|uniref:AraC family transcriptional regulator n=1 Tax=Secundilactobacillus similis DSM 23365 = JCM 2765 TaxID=1423804 RepID=A0A0R2F5V6_9LACO|nr:AraC family transcriptional regulator [Secundilactobacillus similis]KRN21717.1 AraC family transcriptional regulator [Secundilactobacillus similis DSM 23365 = JCM 2765]